MAELDLTAIEAERDRIRTTYLKPEERRPASTARGLHHFALVCSDVEETVRFYQEVLEFPLTEIFENRDYPGSNHFFFDIGNDNLIAFFDFPGLDVGPYAEVLGGLHHIAISVEPDQWQRLRGNLERAGVEYQSGERHLDLLPRSRRRPAGADRGPARRDVRHQGAVTKTWGRKGGSNSMAHVQRLGLVAVLAAAGLAVTGVQPATAGGGGGPGGGPEVIASGLDNPRGLAFDRKGNLFVAEAGTGGAGPCFPGPEGPTVCFGDSGGVTKVTKHGQRRVVTGLGSIANEGTGEFGIGPSDVSFAGKKMFVTEGLGLDLEFSNTVPELADMGQLLAVSKKKHGHGAEDRDGGRPG